MKRYRKKPVVIEAVQWDGTNFHQIQGWCPKTLRVLKDEKGLRIDTVEGQEMTARIGDWIIKGIKKEIYPCKPDIFELTYEEVP